MKCPKCGFESESGNFSYLGAGFNGIEKGDSDDKDMFECQKCDHQFKVEEQTSFKITPSQSKSD